MSIPVVIAGTICHPATTPRTRTTTSLTIALSMTKGHHSVVTTAERKDTRHVSVPSLVNLNIDSGIIVVIQATIVDNLNLHTTVNTVVLRFQTDILIVMTSADITDDLETVLTIATRRALTGRRSQARIWTIAITEIGRLQQRMSVAYVQVATRETIECCEGEPVVCALFAARSHPHSR